MLKDKVRKALNNQLQMEMSSAYLYLAMGAHFDAEDMPGFAKWMKLQFSEEQGHARRIYDYITDRGGRVELQAIDKPTTSFGTPLETFEKTLAHEQDVTASIHKLYELAISEKDYATQTFLQWFVTEQVEEEKTANEILSQLRAVAEQKHALIMFDRYMAQRES